MRKDHTPLREHVICSTNRDKACYTKRVLLFLQTTSDVIVLLLHYNPPGREKPIVSDNLYNQHGATKHKRNTLTFKTVEQSLFRLDLHVANHIRNACVAYYCVFPRSSSFETGRCSTCILQGKATLGSWNCNIARSRPFTLPSKEI